VSTFPLTTQQHPLTARHTLADQFLARSITTNGILIAAGASLTAALAQVVVPLWPVPITGQTLAVLLVGGTLGALRGALSMLLYALLGIVGLPIFSDASSGWNIVAGPTGGYIIGFIVAAAFTGWLAERRWDRKFIGSMIIFFGGTSVTFAAGLPWLAFSLNMNLEQTFQAGLYPFIIGGVIKTVIAAAILPTIWLTVAHFSTQRTS
jgi:biotin transport system substrate-specific component